jgi:hypothetical protein
MTTSMKKSPPKIPNIAVLPTIDGKQESRGAGENANAQFPMPNSQFPF